MVGHFWLLAVSGLLRIEEGQCCTAFLSRGGPGGPDLAGIDVSLTKSQLAYPLSFKEDVLLLSSNLKMVVDAEILSSTIKAESQRS